jgi:hypothetical protein
MKNPIASPHPGPRAIFICQISDGDVCSTIGQCSGFRRIAYQPS